MVRKSLKSPILVSTLSTLHARTHSLQQVALKILTHHICPIHVKILLIGRLNVALRIAFLYGAQISLVIVNTRVKFGLF